VVTQNNRINRNTHKNYYIDDKNDQILRSY